MHRLAVFVLQAWRRSCALRVDDLACGRIGQPAVDAEGDPARLIAELDARPPAGRHLPWHRRYARTD